MTLALRGPAAPHGQCALECAADELQHGRSRRSRADCGRAPAATAAAATAAAAAAAAAA